ncbi:hypothetical protein TNCV_3507741 [Trichonephila clavipes]|uniref:Uncharacterized protein n=1 Tax=Trichonephila clavipes TaxID=2585209 RepID=A0A8X6RXG3_TRICX|nr:hypothetical protein TNCV_3507741 [Trichonephila clavipes]
MLKHMYINNACLQTQAFELHRRFREGRKSFEEAERSERLQASHSAENIENVSAVAPSWSFRIFPELVRRFQDRRLQSANEIKSTLKAELKDMV